MTNTIGGVVSPAEKLISIVPKDSPLIVKVNVLNQDIGFENENENEKGGQAPFSINLSFNF